MTRDPKTWSPYYASTLDKPLHPIFGHLRPFLPAGGTAIELGCGVGHGVQFLLDQGFSVTAVDGEPEAVDIARSRIESDCVTWVCEKFEAWSPQQADVIVAGFSIFFLSPPEFDRFWSGLEAVQDEGCLFAGQFLGINDDWKSRGYTTHTADSLRELLRNWDLLYFEEAERDGFTSVGEPKHWHVFHVVARKRA